MSHPRIIHFNFTDTSHEATLWENSFATGRGPNTKYKGKKAHTVLGDPARTEINIKVKKGKYRVKKTDNLYIIDHHYYDDDHDLITFFTVHETSLVVNTKGALSSKKMSVILKHQDDHICDPTGPC